ncbi:MAG TPA: hypothetical protein VM580_19225 [Labilithrix sp.]|nr:hypothetical protein [Labilithrix sp.]
MKIPPRRLLACSLLVSVACSKSPTSGGPGDGGGAVDARAADAAPLEAVRDAAAARPTADVRAQVTRALSEGRTSARAKDWPRAVATFERGLSVAPNEATLLAELGWAAFNAGDLAKADAAAQRGLASTKQPNLRAQILYTSGRIAEAKKDRPGAQRAYADSLALRDNAEVRRRLEAVGGPPDDSLTCSRGSESIDALCTCLQRFASRLMTLAGQKIGCRVLPVSLSLGTPRLSVVRWGTAEDEGGEAEYLLVARDGTTYRPVAELGRDFEPGAFGVHNVSKVVGGEVKKLLNREVVVVKSEVRNTDMNLAGLEECTDNEDRETVCTIGSGTKPTRCFVVPVSSQSGCGPGVEPDELDEDAKQALEERKAEWKTTSQRLTWSLTADGKLVVRDAADTGGAKGSAIGTHPLF